MRLALAERFQDDVRSLPEPSRAAVFDALLALPDALKEPHRHAGLGIRKLHASGVWEARIGLGVRIVFALERNLCTLVRVGTHDEVRRYLRSL